MRRDPEYQHLIRSWSSGRLDRLPIGSLFPGIEDVSIDVRKAEARKVGWSLDI
jgi:hypothetical protein